MKIGVKTSKKDRVLAKENWKDAIDFIECDQDEWDEWLEKPAAQEGAGQGRVRFVRADLRNPVLDRRRR
jgi:hypothetical protein